MEVETFWGVFLPATKEDDGNPWKMFEPSESAGELVLTIVESGHMLVSQGHDLLDGFSLLDDPSFLKVQQKSDALLFRLTVKGESCSIRMQFSGSRAEALEERGSAVLRLKTCLSPHRGGHHHHSAAPQHPISPLPRPLHRINRRVLGRLWLLNLRLSRALYPSNVLPSTSWASMVCPCPWCPCPWCHSALFRGELEPFLRLCLLDPSFPALVEEVEGELKRVLQN